MAKIRKGTYSPQAQPLWRGVNTVHSLSGLLISPSRTLPFSEASAGRTDDIAVPHVLRRLLAS